MALSLILGNKRKKKAVIKWKSKGWKKAQSIKENRYNAALELSIKEEKENKIYQLSSGKDEDEQFDLAEEK